MKESTSVVLQLEPVCPNCLKVEDDTQRCIIYKSCEGIRKTGLKCCICIKAQLYCPPNRASLEMEIVNKSSTLWLCLVKSFLRGGGTISPWWNSTIIAQPQPMEGWLGDQQHASKVSDWCVLSPVEHGWSPSGPFNTLSWRMNFKFPIFYVKGF